MSKKLEQNGLWEASRMMLPQHREAFRKIQQANTAMTTPNIHEDEFELIIRYIKESLYTHKTIDIAWFVNQTYRNSTGVVDKIDEHAQRIRIRQGEHQTWIPIGQISRICNHSSAS